VVEMNEMKRHPLKSPVAEPQTSVLGEETGRAVNTQIHLRLRMREAEFLRECAAARDQTQSGFVRHLLALYRAALRKQQG
jgi:hypothetical protein